MAELATPFQSDNPIVQRLLQGTAPPQVKLAAARGALPITAEELLHVLAALSSDADPAVQEALPGTVAGLSDETLTPLLRNPALSPALLDFVGRHALDKTDAMAAVVLHKAARPATLEYIAARANSAVLELIVTNQVALIRSAALIDTLLANSALSADQRRRLLEVREEFFVKKELEEKRRRDEEERLAKLRAKKEWTQQELERLQEELVAEAQADQQAGALLPDFDDDEEVESDDSEPIKSALARLVAMSVPEKVLLAIRGSRSERNILIRDANRLVATSALKSPKVNEKDIEHFAGLRNVSDEILRLIGNNRMWLRNYSIVHILVKNPRTPIPVAMNLLNRLQQADIKKLLGDRNVSETLRRQAKQLWDKMGRAAGARH